MAGPGGRPLPALAAFGLAACLLAGPAGQARAACAMTHVADLPLTLFQNKLFVPVTINGSTERLALDTGADSTVLSTAAARRLNVQRDFDHTVEMFGVGGVDNHLYSGAVDHMTIGGLQFDGWHLAIADFDMLLANGESMGGLLGGDILRNFDIDLDIAGRNAAFWRVTGCTDVTPPWHSAMSSVPLLHASHNLMALEIKVDGTPVQLELDTGAPNLVMSERDAARAGVPPEVIAEGRAVHGRGVNDGGYVGHVHIFGDVRVGDARYEEMPAIVVPRSRYAGFDGLLGLAFLMQHRIWLSYATNKLFIQTAPSPAR